MRKVASIVTVAAVLGLMVSGPKQASAQKQYLDAFIAKYDIAEAKEKKCLVCHGAKSKKERSDYAKALEEALGEKKVKDEAKIMAALATVEGKEYEDGKTYGQLLKDGKLPAPFAE